jgi:antitoxin component of MazEF toxin-antitoxin module
MREYVKIREAGGSAVVTLSPSILDAIGLRHGDRVLVEASPPRRILLTKEGDVMPSTARLELEIDLLLKRKRSIESDLAFKEKQYDKSRPCDAGMGDPEVAILVMSELARDKDRLDVQIAEKKLELSDLLGNDTANRTNDVTLSTAETGVDRGGHSHAEQILRAAIVLAGSKRQGTFTRKAVREHLGLDNREWQSGYTAIFQGMRDDHPGGAPPVGQTHSEVFHRVSPGTYELSSKGKHLARRVGSVDATRETP